MVRHTSLWLVLMVCSLGIASQVAVLNYHAFENFKGDWFAGFFAMLMAYVDIAVTLYQTFRRNKKGQIVYLLLAWLVMFIGNCVILALSTGIESVGIFAIRGITFAGTFLVSREVGLLTRWTWRHLLPPTHINEERLRRRCDPPRRNLPL